MKTPMHSIQSVDTPNDLQGLGMGEIAYVKPAEYNGRSIFAIHAADGSPLAATDTVDVAAAFIRRNDMEPTRVH